MVRRTTWVNTSHWNSLLQPGRAEMQGRRVRIPKLPRRGPGPGCFGQPGLVSAERRPLRAEMGNRCLKTLTDALRKTATTSQVRPDGGPSSSPGSSGLASHRAGQVVLVTSSNPMVNSSHEAPLSPGRAAPKRVNNQKSRTAASKRWKRAGSTCPCSTERGGRGGTSRAPTSAGAKGSQMPSATAGC